MVFSFPMKAPEDATTYEGYDPIEHLDLWLIYQTDWCEHKPSVTINYTDNNFLTIGQWVWDNWDLISGISFLPHTDHVYEQAPFEAIDEETYMSMKSNLPSNIDWSKLSAYELEDTTTNTHTLACHGGSCEVVDLVEN
jgi:ribonucleoside-triphosphate reductase